MKNIWNFILKYRIYIAIIILIMVCGVMFVAVKAYVNPDNPEAVYGNRLEGIDKVRITEKKKNEIISFIKEDKTMSAVSIDVKGKIVNILFSTSSEENTIEKMQEFAAKIIEKFSKEEIEFYDFQIFIKNVDGNYNLIGYKNKKNHDFSWNSDEIIKEVEDETKEEK